MSQVKEITPEMRAKYRAGKYRFSVPSVVHRNWDEDDWIRYVVFDSEAPFPLAPIECCGHRMFHVGFSEKGEALYSAEINLKGK